MTTHRHQPEELLLKIDHLREQLIKTGKKYGLHHNKTLKISRELDKLLNEFQSTFLSP